MRPLWLVERHGNKVEAPPDEPLPSLPSSKTSSANASVEDLASLQDEMSWEKLDFSHDIHGSQRPIGVDTSSDKENGDDANHPVLGSEEVTPTAANFCQTNAFAPPRTEKPKYEFHSPSELLQDPSLYAELPPSPTMRVLPSAEGSAVGVKYEDGIEPNLDSLPLLPLSRPSTPENKKIRAPDAVGSTLTQEQTVPDIKTLNASQSHDAPVAEALGAGLRSLDELDEIDPSEAIGNAFETPMLYKEASQSLTSGSIAVLPETQISTTEAVEKNRETPSVRGDAAAGFTDVLNVATAAAVDEECAVADRPLQAAAVGVTKSEVDSTVNEQGQLPEMWPEMLYKQHMPLEEVIIAQEEPKVDVALTLNNEPLSDATAIPEVDSKKMCLGDGKGTEVVDAAASTTDLPVPVAENADKAADETVKIPFEGSTKEIAAPSSSKKKKKDKRKKKGNSLNLDDQELAPLLEDSVGVAAAVPCTSEESGKVGEPITAGVASPQQNPAQEDTKTAPAAEQDSVPNIPNIDEAADIQGPVDMLVSEHEPVVDGAKTKDIPAAEQQPVPKSIPEVETQAFEGSSALEQGLVMKAGTTEDEVGSEAFAGVLDQESDLKVPQSKGSPMAVHTPAAEEDFISGPLRTDVTPDAQIPEITAAPAQEPVAGVSEGEDAPVITDIAPERSRTMTISRTEEALEGILKPNKMLESSTNPTSNAEESSPGIEVFPKNSKRDKKKRKTSKGSVTDVSARGPSGVEVVATGETAAEANTKEAPEVPWKHTVEDSTVMEEAWDPAEECLASTPEELVQVTTEEAESLEKQGESTAQDVTLPEKPTERLADLEKQSNETPQKELSRLTEESVSTHQGTQEVANDPDQLNTAVPEHSAEDVPSGGHGSEKVPAADSQEELSADNSAVKLDLLESKSEVLNAEDGQLIPKEEAETPAELVAVSLISEQKQKQGLSALVETATLPESAEVTAGSSAQDADVTNARAEIPLSRKSSKKNKKKNRRNNATEPALENESDNVGQAVPVNEGTVPQTKHEPTEPPKEEPGVTQPEESHERNEATRDLPPAGEVQSEVVAEAKPTEPPQEAPEVTQPKEVHDGNNETSKDLPPAEEITQEAAMEPAESPKEEPEEKQTEELHDGGSEVTKGLLPAEEVKLVVVEAEPTEAPKEAPDELQGEEVHEEGNEAAKDFPPTEGMLEAAADTPVKSQHVGSAETVKGATSEETSEEQPNVNSKEQAEAEAKTMPENSAGGSTAKTPLAETSGVLHDKQAPQETTATNETTEIKEVDDVTAADNESNPLVEDPTETNDSTPPMSEQVPSGPVPHPELEAGETTPTGKKTKKNKKEKKSKQSLPSIPDAGPIATEPLLSTEVADANSDVPVAAEGPALLKGQEASKEEASENRQSIDIAEAGVAATAPETAHSMTAAQRKKAKKEKKKQRKSASLDELAPGPAAILIPADVSLEGDSNHVGGSAPVQENEAGAALNMEPTITDEIAKEQPTGITAPAEPLTVPNESLDEKPQDFTQQMPREGSGDFVDTVVSEKTANVEPGYAENTSTLEATSAIGEQSLGDAGLVEEQHTVETARIEQEEKGGGLKAETEPVDDTLNPDSTAITEAVREQPQGEAPSKEVVPEQVEGDGADATVVISQGAAEEDAEPSLFKKSKKDKKKKKKRQSLSVEEDRPAAAKDEETIVESIEGPSGTRPDSADTTEQLQEPPFTEDKEKPTSEEHVHESEAKEPAQELEAKEDDPIERPSSTRPDSTQATEQQQTPLLGQSAEKSISERSALELEAKENESTEPAAQTESAMPVELDHTEETQMSTSKKKAKKNKKNRKSVSFVAEKSPTQPPEVTEATELAEQIGRVSTPPEQADTHMTGESTLAQQKQEYAFSISTGETQPIETYEDLPQDVLTASPEQSGSMLAGGVVPYEGFTQPSSESVTEGEAIASDTATFDPTTQTPSVVQEPTETRSIGNEGEVTDKDVLATPETSAENKVEATPDVSVPEIPSTPEQESIAVVEELEQEVAPSKSKKNKKKKKKSKVQESNEIEPSVTPDLSAEKTTVESGDAKQAATSKVIESNNALELPDHSSEDVTAVSPEPSAENTEAEAEHMVEGDIQEANEAEGAEEQATEHSVKLEDDGTPTMSAKERKRAKKREKKRQSKSLDGASAVVPAAEFPSNISDVPEEKGQDPLIFADAASTEDATRDATKTQMSAAINSSDPSVDTAIPPVEDDGKENQSHGIEFHGENDKNLTWTDQMVSSQVDQQQATSFGSHSHPASEDTKIEPVDVSVEAANPVEESEVGTKDHPPTEATSEGDNVSSRELPSEGLSTKQDEGWIAPMPTEDDIISQRVTGAETTGQETMEDTTPAQTEEELVRKENHTPTEAPSAVGGAVGGSIMDDLQAANEKKVPLFPNEPKTVESPQEPDIDVTPEIENLQTATPSKKSKKKRQLRQAQKAESSQQEEQAAAEVNEGEPALSPSSNQPVEPTISVTNLDSATSSENVMPSTKNSELPVINVGPGVRGYGKGEPTAADLDESNLDAADSVSDLPISLEPCEGHTEETALPESAKEPSSEMQGEAKDFPPHTTNKKDKKNKEASAQTAKKIEKSYEIGKVPALVEPVTEQFETHEVVNLEPLENSTPVSEPIPEGKKLLQADIEAAPDVLGQVGQRDIAETVAGEHPTGPLSRRASKKDKKKAKKQAHEQSKEPSNVTLAEVKGEAIAENSPETGSSPTANIPSESSVRPKEEPMDGPELQVPLTEPSVSKGRSQAIPGMDEMNLSMSTGSPSQTQNARRIPGGGQLDALQREDGKNDEVQATLTSQIPDQEDLGTAEEPAEGHSMQPDTSIPFCRSSSKREKKKTRQKAKPQAAESTELPELEGKTEFIEEAHFVTGLEPRKTEPFVLEEPEAEVPPPRASMGRNNEKRKSGEIKQPDGIESVGDHATAELSRDQCQPDTLVTERSTKHDEWPSIDWEKGRVDVVEPTPQSSPEAFAAPFEPGIADFDEFAIPEGLTR
jgi:hypothetical protein